MMEYPDDSILHKLLSLNQKGSLPLMTCYYNFIYIMLLFIFVAPFALIAEDPARTEYNAGVKLATQGNFPSAKSAFQKALEIDSLYVPALLNLSIVENVISRELEEEAALHYFNAIEWGNRDSLDMKIQELSKALAINPKFALAYNERGIALAKSFEYERAIVDYDSALSLMPESAVINFNKALSCDNVDRYTEARDAYINFLNNTTPDYAWYIIYARKRINEINQAENQNN
jgi:lipoprotein NlpI